MRVVFKPGTEASGHFGHEGRPGIVGGSLPSGRFGGEDYEANRARAREALRAHRARERAARLAAQQAQAQTQAPAAENKYNVLEIFSKIPYPVPDTAVNVSMSSTNLQNVKDAFGMDEETLKRFFYIEDKTVTVTFDPFDNKLSAYIYNLDGTEAGQQNIDGNINDVHMGYLRFNDQARDKDLGMPLVIKQMAMFKMLGAKQARMLADITIGKYAWAKPGVHYEGEYQITDAINRFDYWTQQWNSRTVRGEATYNGSVFDYDAVMREKPVWSKFTEPYQWAQYKLPGVSIARDDIYNEDANPGMYEIGKAFMLDSMGHRDWYAKIKFEEINV